MVYNYAKLALLTGFTFMADAKKGKYGYRRGASDDSDEISNDNGDDFVADTWDAQTDSKFPDLDMLDAKQLAKRLRKGKKNKNKKGKNKEKDFAKGVLASFAEAIPDDEETVPLELLDEMFTDIMGEDFDPEDNKAFDRGFEFGSKKLWTEPGCRSECRDAPFAEGCQSCCRSYSHEVDWNCDGEDEDMPIAKCCTEWNEACYTTNSADNNDHACKACGYGYGGYGYGRSYGGYGGYRRGGYGYGRRRASQGYGGRRRRGYGGYGRGRYGR